MKPLEPNCLAYVTAIHAERDLMRIDGSEAVEKAREVEHG